MKTYTNQLRAVVLGMALLASGEALALTGPTPLACMDVKVMTGSVWSPTTPWTAGGITITNQCGQPVDIKNGYVVVTANKALTGAYVAGLPSGLDWPNVQATSSQAGNGAQLSQWMFQYADGNQWWKPSSMVAPGGQIHFSFSPIDNLTVQSAQFLPGSVGPVVTTGSLTFSVAAGSSLPDHTIITVKGTNSSYSASIDYSQTQSLSNLPYDTYQLSASALVNGQTVMVNIAPATIVLNADQKAGAEVLSYVAQTGSLQVLLNGGQPSDVTSNTVTVNVTDQNTHSSAQLPVVWGQTANLDGLKAGDTYTLTANPVSGKQMQYRFTFNPSSFTASKGQQNKVIMSAQGQAYPTGTANVTITGLPNTTTNTHVYFTSDTNSYSFAGTNGTLSAVVPVGLYTVSADTLVQNKMRYAMAPFTVSIGQNQTIPVVVNYQATPVSGVVFSPYVDVSLSPITQWDPVTNGMQPIGLPKAVSDSGVQALHLAFVTAQNGCAPGWAGYSVAAPDSYGIKVFQNLTAQGVKLTVAFGGAAGTYLEQACGSVPDLTKAIQTVIDAYHPVGLDFDIENGEQSDNVTLTRLMQALNTIQANNNNIPVSFTLPVLPTGLVDNMGYNVLKVATANHVQYNVNIMAMDYGSAFDNKTMGENAVLATTATFNQLKALYPNAADSDLWARIGVIPMIGLNDVASETFTFNDVDTLSTFAKQKGLSMVSFWSLTRDHPCASQWASPICSSTPLQTKDYQYSQRFLQDLQ